MLLQLRFRYLASSENLRSFHCNALKVDTGRTMARPQTKGRMACQHETESVMRNFTLPRLCD